MISYWAEHAWLPDGCRSGVRLEVENGAFSRVEVGAARPADQRLSGVLLPGLANGHSHAFHRALRGRTHDDGGTFWTWRQQMYAVASTLDPDSYHALARDVYDRLAPLGLRLEQRGVQRALLDINASPELAKCSDVLWILRYLLPSGAARPIMADRRR